MNIQDDINSAADKCSTLQFLADNDLYLYFNILSS